MRALAFLAVVVAIGVAGSAPAWAAAGDATCPGATSATNDLIVPAGATCTIGAGDVVGHNVVVGAGATFVSSGATIGNDVAATDPYAVGIGTNSSVGNDITIDGVTGGLSSGDNYLCNTHVGGSVLVENSAKTASPWYIGDSDPECTRGGVTVAGDLTVTNNANHVDVSDNGTDHVGGNQRGGIGHDLVITGNASATVEGNVVENDAQCSPAQTASDKDGDAVLNAAAGFDQGCDPSLTVPAGFTAHLLSINGSTRLPAAYGWALGFDSAGSLLLGRLQDLTGSCNGTGGSLYRINGDGTWTPVVAPGVGLLTPQGIVAGPGGAWGTSTYVVDSNSGTNCGGNVWKVNTDGSLTRITDHSVFPGAYEPRGIAFAPSGSFGAGPLWIVESATNTPSPFVQPDSGQLETVPTPGDPFSIFTGGSVLGDPSSIAFGSGAYGDYLYVGDLGEPNGGPPSRIDRMDSHGNVTVFSSVQSGRIAFAPQGDFGGLLYAASNAGGVHQIVSVDANGDGTTFATLDNPLPSQVILNAAPSPNGRDMYALVTDTSSGDSEIFEISGPQLDTTAPAIDCGAADGQWHADNVTISCTASDSGSGLADASDASFTLSTSVASGVETADAATGTRQVCDLAGNCATAGPIDGNMIDRKAPAVTCGSADGLWHNDNVTIACTASDGGSGISAADASFGLSTSVAPGSATANASTGTRSVCDAVGNCATAGPIGGNMIDRSPPVLHLPANIVTGQRSVTYTATATDDDDPSPALTCSPASGSTFPFGTTLVACKATDHAGNATTGGFSITVDPLLTLTNAVAAIGRANLKAHVKNLAQVGGNGYCSQLKVIAGELADVSPVTQAVLDGEAAVAALQRASGCSR